MISILKKLFGPSVDLSEVLQQGAVILDVRTKGEFGSGHVKGSKNIPLNVLPNQVQKIQSWNKPVITCCASGSRSGMAASILKRHGVEAYNGGSWYRVNRL